MTYIYPMSENTEFSSLAQKLADAGIHKTPIARAVAEVVASWLGTNITDQSLIKALQITKEDTGNILDGEASPPAAANDPVFEEEKIA
jgi:hypothetical protein